MGTGGKKRNAGSRRTSSQRKKRIFIGAWVPKEMATAVDKAIQSSDPSSPKGNCSKVDRSTADHSKVDRSKLNRSKRSRSGLNRAKFLRLALEEKVRHKSK